jgi:hypothetical protein
MEVAPAATATATLKRPGDFCSLGITSTTSLSAEDVAAKGARSVSGVAVPVEGMYSKLRVRCSDGPDEGLLQSELLLYFDMGVESSIYRRDFTPRPPKRYR